MKVTNNKPAELLPNYIPGAGGTFDPHSDIQKVLCDPLFAPLIQGSPCTITDNGHAVTPNMVVDYILRCCSDQIDPTAEDFIKQLMGKCLIWFNAKSNLLVKSLFAIQSGKKSGQPEPDSNVVYTPSVDVVPVSKELLAGKCDYDKYFATMAFYTKSNTLGFYFANSAAFADFKTWLSQQVSLVAQNLDPTVNQLFSDFQNLNLDGLTESLMLRNNDSEGNDPYSFPRTLLSLLMTYQSVAGQAVFGVMPFDIGELFCPRTIVFVNVEAHTHASSKQINDEWDIINKSLQNKPAMISNAKLQSLTASMRNLKKIQAAAAAAAHQPMGKGSAGRAAAIKFRKAPPTHVDITKFVMAVLKKMSNVNRSENSYKQVKMSFSRPNRRDPDDFNKMGKVVSTIYRPDIHIYCDTSGSISEENYEDAIRACIKIARKLNVNLYFNSFSHILSQCTKVNTRDRSVEECYKSFQKIPKVDGGTNFEQIWHYINGNPKRERELSIIITDFEWTASSQYVKHPKNLYYMPCSISGHMNWQRMVKWAESFAKSMVHNEPAIRKHIFA